MEESLLAQDAQKVWQGVLCTFCACDCDDLVITTRGNRIASIRNGCALALAKFSSYEKGRLASCLIRRGGRLVDCGLDEALERSAEILSEARYPLLYGWACTSCEAQKVGIELAQEVGGVFDNATTMCHGPFVLATMDAGVPTCTLGEVRHRADLVLYWGCNPVYSHPRHLSRYTVFPEGMFAKGRGDRTVVVVDVRRTPTARLADHFYQVKPNMDYELLSALRMLVRGEEVEQEEVAGIPFERAEELADMMVECRFGVLFVGQGLTTTSGKNRNMEEAISLVKDLNAKTKFSITPMRGHYNVAGCDEVLAWQTGYPYAVDFSTGYPRFNPGETTAADVLTRGDCDAALILGADPLSHFPAPVAEKLASIPTIVVDPHLTPTALGAEVAIPSAIVGVEAAGTVYRMDRVPILAKKVLEPPPGVLPDVELLKMMLERVRARRR